jgi:RNA polymerase sigma factor (sigma-70 family)
MTLEESVKAFMETKQEKYFTNIYSSLKNPLHSFIRKFIKDLDTSKEVLSNAFEHIYIALRDEKYTPMKNVKFTTYAHTCAMNAVRYYFRYYSKTYSTESQMDSPYVENTREDEFLKNVELFEKVVFYIKNGIEDNDLKTVANSFFIEQKKIQEIACDMGIHKSNVKYKIGKIKKDIQSKFKYEREV